MTVPEGYLQRNCSYGCQHTNSCALQYNSSAILNCLCHFAHYTIYTYLYHITYVVDVLWLTCTRDCLYEITGRCATIILFRCFMFLYITPKPSLTAPCVLYDQLTCGTHHSVSEEIRRDTMKQRSRTLIIVS